MIGDPKLALKQFLEPSLSQTDRPPPACEPNGKMRQMSFLLKYRFRLRHVSVFIALAVCIGLAAVILWPRRESHLPIRLSDENFDKSAWFTTRAEYVKLFGPPNSKPDGSIDVESESIEVLSWEDSEIRDGCHYKLRLDVSFDLATGKQVTRGKSCSISPNLSPWDEIRFWAMSLPLRFWAPNSSPGM
jgi:hypothetical protein